MNDLSKLGFERPSSRSHRRRLILALDAQEGRGKSHFALTAPAPIAYFTDEPGKAEELIDTKFNGKDIWLHKLETPSIALKRQGVIKRMEQQKTTADLEHIATAYKPVWAEFEKAYHEVLPNTGIRTVVLETAGGLYRIQRFAEFGQLSKVPERLYDDVHACWDRIFRAAHNSDKNLIIICRMEKQYKKVTKMTSAGPKEDSEWTGKYERKAHKSVGFEINVEATLFRAQLKGEQYVEVPNDQPGEFGMRIGKCFPYPALAGAEVMGDDAEPYGEQIGACNFATLAMMCYPPPMSSAEDWT